jgi:hypothetical protein
MLSIIQLLGVAACGAGVAATAAVELATSAADAAKNAILLVSERMSVLLASLGPNLRRDR